MRRMERAGRLRLLDQMNGVGVSWKLGSMSGTGIIKRATTCRYLFPSRIVTRMGRNASQAVRSERQSAKIEPARMAKHSFDRHLLFLMCLGQFIGMDIEFDIFDRYAKRYLCNTAFETSYDADDGHLFHLSLESFQYASKWTHKARNSKGQNFKLVAGFSDIYSPNAFADRFENAHIIGMHVPLFVAINEFALFCFAQAEFFPELGNSSVEVSPSPWDHRVPGIFLLDHTKQGGHISDKHSHRLIPKDPERYHLASCLSFLMARFVWLHELAHGFNGHVDFVRDHKLALRLYELPDPFHAQSLELVKKQSAKQQVINSQILQQLEFDADRSALWGSVQMQLGELENIQSIINLDALTRMKLTLFGCYAMPWLFEQFQSYMKTQDSLTHPEPVQRLQSGFEVVQSRLLTQVPDLESLNLSVIDAFDRVRARIPSLYDSHMLSRLFAEQAQVVSSELAFGNADLNEQLKPFEFRTRS